MADKKQTGAPSASIATDRDEHVVSIDLERLSSADGSSELASIDDVEAQTQSGTPAGKDGSSSSNSSRGAITSMGVPLMSKWRWLSQQELQDLVTNRRTPRHRSKRPDGTIELGLEPDSSSSPATAAAPPVAAGDALEKGAFVRVVTEGVRIPASLEVASEGGGGRQRIAHILLPTTADSPERDQLGNPDRLPPPPLSNSGELSVALTSAAAAAAGGKKRKVSSVVGDQDGSSLGQDLEKGKVFDEALVAGAVRGGGGGGGVAAGTAGNGYHHQNDDDNEPLCRVCHLSAAKSDVISLGCACKHDLGRAHRACADTWFQVRGNRQCEICGEIAQNVQVSERMEDSPANPAPPDTVITVTVHHPVTICWQNRPIRNFLLVFLVAAFLVPWLFRFAYYRS